MTTTVTLQELELVANVNSGVSIQIQDVFDSFLFDIEGKKRKAIKTLAEQKADMIQTLVDKSVAATGKFIVPDIQDACPDCHGTGRLYKLKRLVKEEDCPACEKGVFKVPCKVCHGSGRWIKKEFKLTRNVECRACQGTGKYGKRCFRCHGSGKVKTFQKIGVESFTKCQTCDGYGFPKLMGKKPATFNPVISPEAASKLNS
jgi:DnaJ-class molecular chaperone